jgi:hypothetical protein
VYVLRVTNDTTRRFHARALEYLQLARGDLLHARLAAMDARLWLMDCGEARARRAAELCSIVTDAVSHVDRLLFFVSTDIYVTRETQKALREDPKTSPEG